MHPELGCSALAYAKLERNPLGLRQKSTKTEPFLVPQLGDTSMNLGSIMGWQTHTQLLGDRGDPKALFQMLAFRISTN